MTKAYGKGSNEGDIIPSLNLQQVIDYNDPTMSENMNDLCVEVYEV